MRRIHARNGEIMRFTGLGRICVTSYSFDPTDIPFTIIIARSEGFWRTEREALLKIIILARSSFQNFSKIRKNAWCQQCTSGT